MGKISLDRAIKLIRSGEVVAFPTETVYGLGADARNPDAISKIFSVKGRPSDNPLIVHVSSRKEVDEFAAEVPEEANILMEKFWPGPLTLIFKKKPAVLDAITAGKDTVALRWPGHPVAQKLIAQTGPLVAPSANKSGRPSPTKAGHVLQDFGDAFPVLDGGTTLIGLESTVLDVTGDPFLIYRPGVVTLLELRNTFKTPVEMADRTSPSSPAKSPGLKYSHYAPQASVRWLDDDETPDDPDALYLFHKADYSPQGSNTIHYQGDYISMGKELYDRFREADLKDYSKVIVEPFSEAQITSGEIESALYNRISKAVGFKQQ